MTAVTVPKTEQQFWMKIRNYFPWAWRMEDKVTVGRPDMLYRLDIRGCSDTGCIELKNVYMPAERKAFNSGLRVEQSAQLRDWGAFNGGHAYMLMSVWGEWMLFPWDSQAVLRPSSMMLRQDFRAVSAVHGPIDGPGLRHLVWCLEERHMGRM